MYKRLSTFTITFLCFSLCLVLAFSAFSPLISGVVVRGRQAAADRYISSRSFSPPNMNTQYYNDTTNITSVSGNVVCFDARRLILAGDWYFAAHERALNLSFYFQLKSLSGGSSLSSIPCYLTVQPPSGTTGVLRYTYTCVRYGFSLVYDNQSENIELRDSIYPGSAVPLNNFSPLSISSNRTLAYVHKPTFDSVSDIQLIDGDVYSLNYFILIPNDYYLEITCSSFIADTPAISFTSDCFDTDYNIQTIQSKLDLQYFSTIENGDYDSGYKAGLTAGYNNGYSAGYEAGSASAWDSGYNLGYSTGYKEGEKAGIGSVNTQEWFDRGFSEGRTSGYNTGYTEGFNAGKIEGASSANKYTFNGLIGAVIDAPITALTGLLNWDLFGVNLFSFFTALATVALALRVLSLILGKI